MSSCLSTGLSVADPVHVLLVRRVDHLQTEPQGQGHREEGGWQVTMTTQFHILAESVIDLLLCAADILHL